MKIDVEAIKRWDPLALAALMPTVQRCARSGSRRVGAEELEDDVAQELYMLLLEKMIHKFNPEYNVEPILIKASRLLALSMLRKKKEVLIDNEDGLLDDLIDNEDGLLDDLMDGINKSNGIDESQPIVQFEQESALKDILMSFPGINEGKREKPKADPESLVSIRPKIKRVLSPHNARLREIRLELGLTQEDFAVNYLGIPQATLNSYEYGRTQDLMSTPLGSRVMAKAEEIYKSGKDAARKHRSAADNRPMPEIIKGWTELLMINENDIKNIADCIGVSKSTVHRWSTGNMRPKPSDLKVYAKKISDEAKVKARLNKSNLEIAQ